MCLGQWCGCPLCSLLADVPCIVTLCAEDGPVLVCVDVDMGFASTWGLIACKLWGCSKIHPTPFVSTCVGVWLRPAPAQCCEASLLNDAVMPSIKETPAQKAARLQRKANELQSKVDYQLITSILKSNQFAVQACKRQLEALGLLPGGGAAIAEPLLPVATSQSTTKAIEDGQVDVGEATGDEDARRDAIHRNFATWGTVPLSWLKRMMAWIEPITFSPSNLKGLMVKGQRDASKAQLLELFELSTGWDPSSGIGDERGAEQLKETLERQSAIMGRRGRDIMFPVSWDKAGVYLIESQGDHIWVVNRFVETRVLAPSAFKDIASMHIEQNWSEHRAVLRDRTNASSKIYCIHLFKDQIDQESSLSGGPLATPSKGWKRSSSPSSMSSAPGPSIAKRMRGSAAAPPMGLDGSQQGGEEDDEASQAAGASSGIGKEAPASASQASADGAVGEAKEDKVAKALALESALGDELGDDRALSGQAPGVAGHECKPEGTAPEREVDEEDYCPPAV
jgi:hypothetical protein